jgi:hypothetical protein
MGDVIAVRVDTHVRWTTSREMAVPHKNARIFQEYTSEPIKMLPFILSTVF